MLKTSFFIDIWFVKQDIKKWLKTKICSFLWLIWKWKEKRTKKLTFPNGDLNPRFLNKFPPKIWIFREIRLIELGVLRTSGLYYVYLTFRPNVKILTIVIWYIFSDEITSKKLTLCLDVTFLNQSCWQMKYLVPHIQVLQKQAINSGVLIQ